MQQLIFNLTAAVNSPLNRKGHYYHNTNESKPLLHFSISHIWSVSQLLVFSQTSIDYSNSAQHLLRKFLNSTLITCTLYLMRTTSTTNDNLWVQSATATPLLYSDTLFISLPPYTIGITTDQLSLQPLNPLCNMMHCSFDPFHVIMGSQQVSSVSKHPTSCVIPHTVHFTTSI